MFLVVDGHPSHRAKVVAKYVAACRGGLELHFLPPYAPDLNPDEFVWQHASKATPFGFGLAGCGAAASGGLHRDCHANILAFTSDHFGLIPIQLSVLS